VTAAAETDRRWRVIAAVGVIQILAWGSSYYLLAVLAGPIARDTGWSYPWVIAGVSLGLLVAGAVSIRVGRTIEEVGGRRVLAAAALLLAAGLAVMAVAPGVPIYLAAWVLLGAGMGAGLYDAAFSTLGRLYGAEARSAITQLTLWGGFASTVCWPLSAWLVEAVGWRGACLAYAGLHLVVTLPLALLAVPREARRERAAPQPHAADLPGEASASRALTVWLLAAILTVAGVVAAIWSVHLITILQARGVGLASAVALGALVGPAQVGARVIEMASGGRHHPIWTLATAAVLIAAGLVLLRAGVGLLAVALIAYGAGNGIWSIARGTLPLALFGPEGYAVLMGRLAMPSLIAQALAPSAGALLLQSYGAPATLAALAGLALVNLVAVAALWMLARPRVAQGGGVRASPRAMGTAERPGEGIRAPAPR
jgi:predicted MFS family arabinose efflux permease